MAVIFFALSFGTLGNPVENNYSLGPLVLFRNFYPGVSIVRAAGRFGIPALLFFSIIAGYVVQKILYKMEHSKKIAISLSTIFLIILEQFTLDLPIEKLNNIPELYSKIEKNSLTITLPLSNGFDQHGFLYDFNDFSTRNTEAMIFASQKGFKTVNGYSGIIPPLIQELTLSTYNFPDEKSFIELNKVADLKYIIYKGKIDKIKDFSMSSFNLTTYDITNGYYLFEKTSK